MWDKFLCWITDPALYLLALEETAKFVFSSVFLAGLLAWFLKLMQDFRLRKIRRRAAQFLWSQAFTACIIQSDIEDLRESSNVSEEEKNLVISGKVIALRNSATLMRDFVLDHATVLPDDAFLHTSLLRMNGQFALALADVLEDPQYTADERIDIFIQYTYSDQESGTGQTLRFGLRNICEFFTRATTPVVSALGMPEPPEVVDMIKSHQQE